MQTLIAAQSAETVECSVPNRTFLRRGNKIDIREERVERLLTARDRKTSCEMLSPEHEADSTRMIS